MTAESESEVKAEESVSVSVSVPASTSTSASTSASASASVPTSASASASASEKKANGNGKVDIASPTAAGGYKHTNASRAKISAANKGKVPWNKGKGRSEEVKKKIAEGVRRKNRERFLAKLEDMGLTEEEYEQQKKDERRKKDAEKRARRTENGGYRPTEETKQKISKILKEKFASGEIKRSPRASSSRKGFKHSEATRAKISAALRKKWATDTEYQAKQSQTQTGKANGTTARRKISKTLKEKWRDPAFREKMMKSMKSRKVNSGPASLEQREKISAAMKKKWQDKEYRAKTMTGMEKYRDSMPKKPVAEKKKQQSQNSAAEAIIIDSVSAVTAVVPQTIGAKKKRTRRARSTIKVGDLDPTSFAAKKAKTKKKKMKKKAKTKTKKKKKSSVSLVESAEVQDGPKLKPEKEEKKKSEDGNISLMREERRDLYDLLYGDDTENSGEEDLSFEEANTMSKGAGGVIDLTVKPSTKNDSDNEPKGLSFYTATTDLDDDNLDEFDPYNLDDY